MTQAITNNFTTMMRYKERLVATMIAILLVSACTYAFFLQRAITNVVEREHTVRDIALKSTHVSELESKYFALKNDITMDLAHAKGFKDTQVSTYISKKSVTAMVSSHEL